MVAHRDVKPQNLLLGPALGIDARRELGLGMPLAFMLSGVVCSSFMVMSDNISDFGEFRCNLLGVHSHSSELVVWTPEQISWRLDPFRFVHLDPVCFEPDGSSTLKLGDFGVAAKCLSCQQGDRLTPVLQVDSRRLQPMAGQDDHSFLFLVELPQLFCSIVGAEPDLIDHHMPSPFLQFGRSFLLAYAMCQELWESFGSE